MAHALQGASSFQPRPELEQILAWWREPRPGVCALVGLGGAGKTALAERFASSLPTDARAFIFSFYEQPVVDAFFAALDAWISGELPTGGQTPSHLEVLDRLKRTNQRQLLILDGLERMQSDGSGPRALGEIEDTPLRDLLMRAASGMLGQTAVLTTTRFPIEPLEREQQLQFRRIDVLELSDAAAIALARRRGIGGSDEEVRAITDACGRHALLVDLAAACIAEFGESAAFLALDEMDEAVLSAIEPARRPLVALQRRFVKMARRFRVHLEEKHPGAWALFRLACLFRHGASVDALLRLRAMETFDVALRLTIDREIADRVDIEGALRDVLNGQRGRLARTAAELLQQRMRDEPPVNPAAAEWVVQRYSARFSPHGALVIELSPDGEQPSLTIEARVREAGPHRVDAWLNALDPEEQIEVQLHLAVHRVRAALKELGRSSEESLALLSRLSLIDARSGRVLVHPAVREGVVRDPREVEREHRRAWAMLESVDLAGRPGGEHVVPDDWEELVHHMIGAKQSAAAWSFYHRRLHGFVGLGVRGAAYARGEALLRMLAGGASPLDAAAAPALDPRESAAFFNEWGLYLHHLGRLAEASTCFRRAAERASDLGRPWLGTVALQNLADAELLAGSKTSARSTLASAAELLARGGDPPKEMRDEERFARDGRPEVLPSLAELGVRLERPTRPITDEPIESLLARGAWSEAERFCRFALIGARAYHRADESTHHAWLSLHLGRVAREMGDRVRALGHLKIAREWALNHGDRELLARAYLESARSGDASDPREDWLAEGERIAIDSGYRGIEAELRVEIEAQPRLETLARPRARVLVAYVYRDSQWLEELLRALEDAGFREPIDLWHDGLPSPDPPAREGRVLVALAAGAGLPVKDGALLRVPIGSIRPGMFAIAARQIAAALIEN